MDDIKFSRLQDDVSGLLNTLEERDQFINKLSGDMTDLQSKNLALEAQLERLKVGDTDGEAVATEKSVTQTAAVENIPAFSESRQEIEQLEMILRRNLSALQVSAEVISEMEAIRLKRDVAVNELAKQSAELATAKVQAVAAQMENADLKDRLLRETQAASAANLELGIIKQRVELSFTASQLSGYLSQAIDNFNREANAKDLSINYIINEMTVTFRASLTKNATGEMTLAAPSMASGDEALSTIKFNIMAVPKQEETK